MRRETAIAIMLVMASIACGYLLCRWWGFNPLHYSEQLGLSPNATISALFIAMFAVLLLGIVEGNDPPASALASPSGSETHSVTEEPAFSLKDPLLFVEDSDPRLSPVDFPTARLTPPSPPVTLRRRTTISHLHDPSEETHHEALEVPDPVAVDLNIERTKSGGYRRVEN